MNATCGAWMMLVGGLLLIAGCSGVVWENAIRLRERARRIHRAWSCHRCYFADAIGRYVECQDCRRNLQLRSSGHPDRKHIVR